MEMLSQVISSGVSVIMLACLQSNICIRLMGSKTNKEMLDRVDYKTERGAGICMKKMNMRQHSISILTFLLMWLVTCNLVDWWHWIHCWMYCVVIPCIRCLRVIQARVPANLVTVALIGGLYVPMNHNRYDAASRISILFCLTLDQNERFISRFLVLLVFPLAVKSFLTLKVLDLRRSFH